MDGNPTKGTSVTRLSVSIVTYHGDDTVLLQTLQSLITALQRASTSFPVEAVIRIVSNDENDQAAQQVAHRVKRVSTMVPDFVTLVLLHGHGNIGFGAGHNLAIRHSMADFHLILNPDVVLDPKSIIQCLTFLMDHPNAAICIPQGYDSRGDYACLAKREPSVFVLFLRGLTVRPTNKIFGSLVGRYIYNDRLPSRYPENVQLASGCFMFCRMQPLTKVGGFDERFFLYFEDYDLSTRIAEHGEIYELPDVTIKHYGGRTAQQSWLRIGRFIRSAWTYFGTYGWRLI